MLWDIFNVTCQNTENYDVTIRSRDHATCDLATTRQQMVM